MSYASGYVDILADQVGQIMLVALLLATRFRSCGTKMHVEQKCSDTCIQGYTTLHAMSKVSRGVHKGGGGEGRGVRGVLTPLELQIFKYFFYLFYFSLLTPPPSPT